MTTLPNGDETDHELRWWGMLGSEWPSCVRCGYSPDWHMKFLPVKTPSTAADLTCPGAAK